MKKIMLTAVFAFATLAMQAQVKTPQASPSTKIEQVVGLTDVEIDYSRPSTKGRTVYGELVPYGKLWRTGANANTTITFSEDVIIDGKTLKKGKYALYTLPKADSWDVIFYADTDNWGLPENWDDAKVVLRTTVKPETLNRKVETFTIGVNNVDNDSASLELSWEKTIVAVKFEVPTQKTAMKSIEKTLAGPSSSDFFSSAQYFYQSNGDLNKALTWVNKAVDMEKEPPFWYLRLKSLIQAKKGDKVGAVETAKLSLAAAEKAKNMDYVKMNKDSIAEWSKK
ncbi:hypothetical protein FCR2A7T_29010 [Flavobacterium cauense R2A-7]|uniref:DUF2911 family protein n=1 Tax=Flavobacterium cauense R2A-7 TaxID=1341154 RepID=V6RVQ8_9FLAO|nr:DUF2911 domain-containing protein [Flavobacterium cauense]ESU18603.1 hypothetical protein FCR2A7T_29010 [Flavobacterium cauense R2A-7]KGO80691.1 dihydrolipoamide dehydrogenase [Flavobacterium cauense R2A-7]TWI11839.1 Protein of unknown function (DUF2911) [Flavobacterium cauense R2A-7]